MNVTPTRMPKKPFPIVIACPLGNALTSRFLSVSRMSAFNSLSGWLVSVCFSAKNPPLEPPGDFLHFRKIRTADRLSPAYQAHCDKPHPVPDLLDFFLVLFLVHYTFITQICLYPS